MAVHAIDVVSNRNGLMCWHCTCGKHLYSRQGFDRHLAIATGAYPAPWPGAYFRRSQGGL